MSKKTYIQPTTNAVMMSSESVLLSGSIEMNVVNDDSQTVDTSSDLWSNKQSNSPIWGNED